MKPRMSHAAAVLRLYYVITFISFGVFLPFLPPWLEGLGIGGFGLGVIFALRPTLAVFSPVLFGVVADRFGLRGALLRLACIASGLSMAGMALLPLFGIPLGFFWVLAGMTLFSFFRAPMVSIADVTTLEGAKSRYGTIRLFGSSGFLIAALTAGYLMDPARVSLFPAVIAVCMLFAAGVAFAIPGKVVNPPKPNPEEMRALFGSGGFRWFLLTAFLWLASHAAYDVSLSLHLRDLGASGRVIGWAWAVGTAFEIVLMSVSASLLRRFTPPGLMMVSLAAMTVRFGLMAIVSDFRVLLLLQPLHALSFALFWVAGIEYVRRRAPKGMLATAQGLFSASASLGGGLSMLIWGPLYGETRGAGVFAGAAVVAASAFLVSLRLKREPFLPEEAP